MKMNEFLLKEEFEKWLVLNAEISPASAKSYLSYVSSVNKIVKFKNENYSMFSVIRRKYKGEDIQGIEKLINQVIQKLSNKKGEIVFNRSLKTLQNYKSGLFQYLEFLIETTIIENKTDMSLDVLSEVEDMLNLVLGNVEEQYYSKGDLISTFRSRIKTQDRAYKDVFFPIRFITRVFRDRGEQKSFKEWLSKLIDSIIIYTEKEKLKLSEITDLSIVNRRVYISFKGEKHLAYTKTSDDETLELFDVEGLDQISLDHITSLYEIMNKNIDRLQVMVRITNELKKYIEGDIVTYSKLSEISKIKELDSFIESVDTDNLLKELELISWETSLQLMDRSYNTSKGKK